MLSTATQQERLRQYHAFWHSAEADGIEPLRYPCPHCQTGLKTLRPPTTDAAWDSLVACPQCNGHFWRVAHSHGDVHTWTLPQ